MNRLGLVVTIAASTLAMVPAVTAGTRTGMRINGDKITIDIRGVRVIDFLQDLADDTKAEIVLMDSALGDGPVTLVARDLPIEVALKRALRDFSYAIFTNAKTQTLNRLLIVDGPTKGGAARQASYSASEPQYEAIPLPEPSPLESPDPDPVFDEQSTNEQSLQGEVELVVDAAQIEQEVVVERIDEELREEEIDVLEGALNDLAVGDSGRRLQSLGTLAQSSDPLAIQALSDAAYGNFTGDAQVRSRAVQLLYQRAEQDQFADPRLLNLFKQLSDDPDPSVSQSAKQAFDQANRANPPG